MVNRQIILPQNRNLFLFGPRQTGKSTLIKSSFFGERCLYIDLLNSDDFLRFSSKPRLFREEVITAHAQRGITHVVIDEVQKVPELLDEIHSLIESDIPCFYIMSGSSARKLKRVHANMLGGRAWTYTLYPFSVIESGSAFCLETALGFGSLPPVCMAETDNDRSEILHSYVNTYLREEIEVEAQVRNLSGFIRFLPMAAAENGNIVNFSNIARETSISLHTVKSYYQILEDTLLGFFLYPYTRSIRKQLSRHPKFYLFDTGVCRAIIKKSSVSIEENGEEYGRAFEHFIICEILKLNEYNRLDLSLSFYRTEQGAEVDCVIETPSGRTLALEIKITPYPASAHMRGLRSFIECVPNAECILVCKTPRPVKIGNCTALNWRDVLDKIAGLK
jgi:predicted AAA+ superfamily ATPase